MREKLIELLKESRDICRGRDYEACKECSGYGKGLECITLLTADHLIANGVTVRKKGSHVKRAVSKTYSENGELISVQYKTFCPFCGLVCGTLFCAYCGADMRGGS